MGGQVLEYEAKTIYNEGQNEGRIVGKGCFRAGRAFKRRFLK